MKLVVQRVSNASVKIDNEIKGEIDDGLLLLVGVGDEDNEEVLDWMCNKIINLRVFPDDEGKMNLSVKDISGGLLVISNFTLYGVVKKGYRPSFSSAGKPDFANQMYEKMISKLKESGLKVETGEFAADMDVSLTNRGPVTLIIEK